MERMDVSPTHPLRDMVRWVEAHPGVVDLMCGLPALETLDSCRQLVKEATAHVLDQELGPIKQTFSYGDDKGDPEFCEELARFLSKEYGDTVQSSNLMVTAGATQALHMIVSLFFDTNTTVFTEDPTFYTNWNMLEKDLHMNLVSVPCDTDGIDVDALDALLTQHRPRDLQLTSSRPFWTMVYTIPVFNNPTARCHTPERCRRLVELARKHDVLLIADDVYNMLHYGDCEAPPRLLTYNRPGDGQGWGHTLSLGTFSKILAPGLRLGWVEGPEPVLRLLYDSNLIWGTGGLNHYASKLLAAAMKLGLMEKHLVYARGIYKEKRDAVCDMLQKNLLEGTNFIRPQGGVFLWIVFPKGTDTFKMVEWLIPNYKLFAMPGVGASASGQFRNCARISIGHLRPSDLVEATTRFCKGAAEFIRLKTDETDDA